MPSSYSPDLRLELPADGEQTGLWGQTTNRNVGTLLESSISGFTSVSVTSANQALTALNGVDDQARHAVLSLTTTTTAAFAVYAPPASKTYIVRNTTAYTATIYNSTALGNTTAAGIGIAVPASKTLMVFTDGTNFCTIDAVNLTGTLAVANGGTGVTTSTGTGSTVLSVSPALTGTPTAPTATLGTSTTQLATTAFVDRFRGLFSGVTTGTLTVADRGCLCSITAGVTIPASVFAAGDVVTIFNNTTNSFTLTQGAGLTMYLVGTATTGNRIISQRGLATVVFISATVAVISGGGLG